MILKTKQNSPATVEANLQKLEYTQFPASIIVLSLSHLLIGVVSAALAELRAHRGAQLLPQAHLRDRELPEAAARPEPDAVVGERERSEERIVDGERKTEGSVEEFILEAFRRVYKVGKSGKWGVGRRV